MSVKFVGISEKTLREAVKSLGDQAGWTNNLLAGMDRLNWVASSRHLGFSDVFEIGDVGDTRDTLAAGRSELLTPAEQKGALTFLDMLNDPTEFNGNVAIPRPKLTIPPRNAEVTLAQIQADIASGKLEATRLFCKAGATVSFRSNTRSLDMRPSGNEDETVDLAAVAERIASTRTGTDDGDGSNLLPAQLKAGLITGDPYPADRYNNNGFNDGLKRRATPAEELAALYLYDFYFNPKPTLSALPKNDEVTVGSLRGIDGSPVTIGLSRSISSNQQSNLLYAQVQELVIRGKPGTVVMLGEVNGDREAILNQAFEIGSGGEIRAAMSPRASTVRLAGVVLQDPDGLGVVSPKVIGNFAVTADIRRSERLA